MTSRLALGVALVLLATACSDTGSTSTDAAVTRSSAPPTDEAPDLDDLGANDRFISGVKERLTGNILLRLIEAGPADILDLGRDLCNSVQAKPATALREIGFLISTIETSASASLGEAVEFYSEIVDEAGESLCPARSDDFASVMSSTAIQESYERESALTPSYFAYLDDVYFMNSPSPADGQFIDTAGLLGTLEWLELGWLACDLSDAVDGETFTYGDAETEVADALIEVAGDRLDGIPSDDAEWSSHSIWLSAHDNICSEHDEPMHEWQRYGQYEEPLESHFSALREKYPELATAGGLSGQISDLEKFSLMEKFLAEETGVSIVSGYWLDFVFEVCGPARTDGLLVAADHMRYSLLLDHNVVDSDDTVTAAALYALAAYGCPDDLQLAGSA